MAWVFRVCAAGGTEALGNLGPFGDVLPESLRLCFDFEAVLLWVKGDWAEHAKTLGLGNWATTNAPCSLCKCTKSELHLHYRQMSSMGLPFLPRTRADYFESVSNCEVRVQISSEADRRAVTQIGLLSFQRRKTGPSGYIIMRDVPSLGLKDGDRNLGRSWHLSCQV